MITGGGQDMFGYVQANLNDLQPEEQSRYRAAYCGLCRTLGKRYGAPARMGLTYDLTFLTLLLSSLYEPEEEQGKLRCLPHPQNTHAYISNVCTEYAADMTVVLVYHKCMDDWKDEHKVGRSAYASWLERPYAKVRKLWQEKCLIIEDALNCLARIEQAKETSPDAAANCFGALMEELFSFRTDRWQAYLRALGNSLGRYIYLADAMIDREQDRKHGNYNPLESLDTDPIAFRSTLMAVLSDASLAFESLPLVQDVHILRNILYSGLWLKYNRMTQPRPQKEKS